VDRDFSLFAPFGLKKRNWGWLCGLGTSVTSCLHAWLPLQISLYFIIFDSHFIGTRPTTMGNCKDHFMKKNFGIIPQLCLWEITSVKMLSR